MNQEYVKEIVQEQMDMAKRAQHILKLENARVSPSMKEVRNASILFLHEAGAA